MDAQVKYIPDGYHTVTPYLTVDNLKRLIEFVKQAFGAEEVHVNSGPDGEPRHAELRIGDSRVMAGQGGGAFQPKPSQLYLYLPDCDAAYQRALAAGATSLSEPATQFYGDRHAGVTDPCGNLWWVATHVEDVSPEEIERRAKAAWGGKA
jgi:PhnB protein